MSKLSEIDANLKEYSAMGFRLGNYDDLILADIEQLKDEIKGHEEQACEDKRRIHELMSEVSYLRSLL